NYYVSMDHSIIKSEAAARDVDIVMFGHTHKPLVDLSGPVIAVNPGSLTYPRQNGRRSSYIVMEAEEGRAPEFEIRYL
ncbi:MAG: metallophosphoesterase family protein, partial [Lachnospiraceae bacterium]|nr:metallophosphoesterase family protein [Lachnospiraceae bacterium]